MSTDNEPDEPRMPEQPADAEGIGKIPIGFGVLLANFLAFLFFRLMDKEHDAYFPDKVQMVLWFIVGVISLAFSVTMLCALASQSAWRKYAAQAEDEFAKLQGAHRALLGETAEYRKARNLALERRRAKEAAELAALETGVIGKVIAYEVPDSVPDDKPSAAPGDAKNL